MARSMPPRSPIAHDDELASFILRAATTMMQKDIPAACCAQFGASRAPSRSAVNRYVLQHTTVAQRTFKRHSIRAGDPS